MTTNEKDYLIEAITEQLKECNDVELLYLIRSLLVKEKEA